MVKTFGYDNPRTKQGPLRRTLARVGKSCQKTVSPTNARDGPLVNRWGIDATVDGHLSKILEVSFLIVSEHTYGCAAWKEELAVDGPTIRRLGSRRWGLCFAACFDLFFLII